MTTTTIDNLVFTLREISNNDTNYKKRYPLVFKALSQALDLGYKAGVRVDPQEPNWPVVQIELPNYGQISWHVPAHDIPYDGQCAGTEEKYKRIDKFYEDQVCQESNKKENFHEEFISPSGKYKLITDYYYSNELNGSSYSRGIVTLVNEPDKILYDLKRHTGFFLEAFVHGFVISKDNEEWLLFGRHYTNYNYLNLDTGFEYESPKDGRNLCRMNIEPCPDNKTLLVNGLYWGGPYETVLYDFSPPNNFDKLKIQIDPPINTRYGPIDGTNNFFDGEEVVITPTLGHMFHVTGSANYSQKYNEFLDSLDLDKTQDSLSLKSDVINKIYMDFILYRDGDILKLYKNNL